MDKSSRATQCVACGSSVKPWARARIRLRYDIHYFRCECCGLIQTEDPHWLAEAYAEPINRVDVGYISRNLRFRDATRLLIDLQFDSQGKYLDYGSGYGMFVRLMRDAGYDFWGFDVYCKSLFAQDFLTNAQPPERYDLVTAFEVFEHLPNPRQEMQRIFSLTDALLFSTECQPSPAPLPEQWEYYGLDHGQHITLYSQSSLEQLCAQVGVNYYRLGKDLHLASLQGINPCKLALLSKSKLARIYGLRPCPKSRLMSDYQLILRKIRDAA